MRSKRQTRSRAFRRYFSRTNTGTNRAMRPTTLRVQETAQPNLPATTLHRQNQRSICKPLLQCRSLCSWSAWLGGRQSQQLVLGAVHTMKICLVNDCDGKFHAKDLCEKHYKAHTRAKNKNKPKSDTDPGCIVATCLNKHLAQGFCSTHYKNRDKYIITEIDPEEFWAFVKKELNIVELWKKLAWSRKR